MPWGCASSSRGRAKEHSAHSGVSRLDVLADARSAVLCMSLESTNGP